MNRFRRMLGAVVLTCALLSGCAGVEATLAPEVDLSRYEAVYLVSPQEDPLGLEVIVADELAGMGYEVLEGPSAAGKGPEVRFSYSQGPDLDEEGDVVTRMTRFAVRFIDANAERTLAKAEYFSGGEAATAAEGIGAAFDKLRVARVVPPAAAQEEVRAPQEPKPQVQSAASEPQGSPKAQRSASSETPKPGLSEAESQDSPWMPRIESWGFEEWGKE